jgi:hypothetical protein
MNVSFLDVSFTDVETKCRSPQSAGWRRHSRRTERASLHEFFLEQGTN